MFQNILFPADIVGMVDNLAVCFRRTQGGACLKLLGTQKLGQRCARSALGRAPALRAGRGQGHRGKVWPYGNAGIAVGAGIRNYVPENLMASIMGKGAEWSVPLALGMGVPMYSNAAGIVPVVRAFFGKGAALGTVLAFMMSVIGLSPPETVILRNVLKPRLIGAFIGVAGVGILMVGHPFNLLL